MQEPVSMKRRTAQTQSVVNSSLLRWNGWPAGRHTHSAQLTIHSISRVQDASGYALHVKPFLFPSVSFSSILPISITLPLGSYQLPCFHFSHAKFSSVQSIYFVNFFLNYILLLTSSTTLSLKLYWRSKLRNISEWPGW